MVDDLETAILTLLAERPELYPSQIAGELRRRAPGLASPRVRPTLDRLFAERRVARLWHRYLLPGEVAAVRTRWLRSLTELARQAANRQALARAHAIVGGWDGWQVGLPA